MTVGSKQNPVVATYACERCRLRRYAERRPRALLARLWHWHTKWCPGWKKYQDTLQAACSTAAANGHGPLPAGEPPEPVREGRF